MNIKFKALRGSSEGYRQIKKSGDLQYDHDMSAKDVLLLRTKDCQHRIVIDCDKKTGEFTISFSGEWELNSETERGIVG